MPNTDILYFGIRVIVPLSHFVMSVAKYIPRTQHVTVSIRVRYLLSQEMDWLWASDLMKTDTNVTRVKRVSVFSILVELRYFIKNTIFINADTADDIFI